MVFPKLKKKISAFLPDESGKTSKQSLMLLASIIGGAAISAVLKAKDVKAAGISGVTVDNVNHVVTGFHSHHASHSSHSSY